METRPVAEAAPNTSRGSETGPAPATAPAVRPPVDIVAITQRDDFLIELGEAILGQAAVQPVDSIAAALGQLAKSRRSQVLAIDTRDVADVRAAVEQAALEAPHAVTMLFAAAEAEKAVGAAIKGLKVQAVLPLPLDMRKASAALETAFAEAANRKPTLLHSPDIQALALAPEIQLTLEPPQAGSIGRWVAAVVGLIVLAAGVGWWWYTQPRAAAAPRAADRAAEQGIDQPLLAETGVLQGDVDELLEKARQALRDRRFAQPPGDNALLYYRSALAKDPASAEARDGVQRVAAALFTHFEESLNSAHLDDAALTLASLRVATPQDSRLAGLELRVASAQISRAVEDGNFDRASAVVREAQLSGLVPADQLARWRADIAHRQDDSRITRLAALVTDRIRDGKLDDPPQDSARTYVEQLKQAGPANIMTQRAVHDLASAYLGKAREAAFAKNSVEVDHWLQEARDAGANAAEVEAIRHESLSAQRQKAIESDRLLGLFHDRLRDGKLSDPAQDSAAYYLTQLQASDPSNAALPQADHDLAAKLLERARNLIATGKGGAMTDADLSLARRYGADPREVSAVQQLEASRSAAATAPARTADASSSSASASSSGPPPPPKLLRYVQPEFPPKAVEQNLAGDVTVRFIIDVNGDPRDVRVVEATPPGVFDHAAINAVKRWHYQPTVLDGKPVEVPLQRAIHFAQGQ
jgi:TonB family protein